VAGGVEYLRFEVFAICVYGECTRADFFGTGMNSRNIPKRPIIFHERSLACVRTGHLRVVGTVEYLFFEVFAIRVFGLRHGDEFP